MKSLLQLLNAGCVAVTAIDINKYMCGCSTKTIYFIENKHDYQRGKGEGVN